jgi:hypothetical protein
MQKDRDYAGGSNIEMLPVDHTEKWYRCFMQKDRDDTGGSRREMIPVVHTER